MFYKNRKFKRFSVKNETNFSLIFYIVPSFNLVGWGIKRLLEHLIFDGSSFDLLNFWQL